MSEIMDKDTVFLSWYHKMIVFLKFYKQIVTFLNKMHYFCRSETTNNK